MSFLNKTIYNEKSKTTKTVLIDVKWVWRKNSVSKQTFREKMKIIINTLQNTSFLCLYYNFEASYNHI